MKWKMYDELIAGIPKGITVEAATHKKWWLVKTKDSMGISMYFEQGEVKRTLPEDVSGMDLKELASYAKSWNFYEATLGMAAINAWYNRAELIAPMKPYFSTSVFDEYVDEVRGKRAAVIGHFPFMEKIAEAAAEYSILEKRPSEGDYPDSACEYILPGQDYVFITGTTFANKTLPRLLDLCRGAKVIMTGPSVPLAPILFDYGIYELAGTIAEDYNTLWDAVGRGEEKGIFKYGAKMLQIRR